MAIITTRNYQNPKPVRGIDYAGQPIPDGGNYNGRPEHQSPDAERRENAPPSPVKAPPTRRKRRFALMSPEAREKARERMRRYWERKRGAVDTQSTVHVPDLPSVSTGVDT